MLNIHQNVERQHDITNKYAVFCKQTSERELMLDRAESTWSLGGSTCSINDDTPVSAAPKPSRLRSVARRFGKQILGHIDSLLNYDKNGVAANEVMDDSPSAVLNDLERPVAAFSLHTKAQLVIASKDPEEFRKLQHSLRRAHSARGSRLTTNMGIRQALLSENMLDERAQSMRDKLHEQHQEERLLIHEQYQEEGLLIQQHQHSGTPFVAQRRAFSMDTLSSVPLDVVQSNFNVATDSTKLPRTRMWDFCARMTVPLRDLKMNTTPPKQVKSKIPEIVQSLGSQFITQAKGSIYFL
jgi:hypothetical protein